MPRLLQINVTCNWGSTGQIAELCNQFAAKKDWEVFFAYGRYSNTSQSKLVNTSSRWDVYEHYVEKILFNNEGLASRKSTKRLIEEIKRIEPDIIHLHNIHDHWLNYSLLFEYLNQTVIKVVWTFHDFWAITGKCGHFIYVDCEKYVSGCDDDCPYYRGHFLPIVKNVKKQFELKKSLFVQNNHLTIVPVSEWVAENVRKSFLSSKPIIVIQNGIDTKVFKPTPTSFLPKSQYEAFLKSVAEKFLIISVASQWKYKKGLDDFKKLSEYLKEDELIALVGVDDKIIAELPNNIIGIKRTTNQQELAALYTRADVVCSLSSAETFALTIAEGYACGTPAVVYNNTALPSIVYPDTGFVVPDRDVFEAYTAIQKIRQVGKSFYKERCVTIAQTLYDKNVCYNKYVELYDSLLKNE